MNSLPQQQAKCRVACTSKRPQMEKLNRTERELATEASTHSAKKLKPAPSQTPIHNIVRKEERAQNV
jgi:hypothetical protein